MNKNTSVIMASAIAAVLAMGVLAHTAFAFTGGPGGAGGSGNKATAKSTANAVNDNTGTGSGTALNEKNYNDQGKQNNKADATGIDQDAIAYAHSTVDQYNNGGNGGDAK